MDTAHFEYLMQLDKSGQVEDAIRECQILLDETTDANERASLLTIMHVSYCKIGRLQEAQQTLEHLKGLQISDIGIRLNAEFCEPAFLVFEGRYEEGLTAFAAMLHRNRVALEDPEHRYLYEDIQCRRALILFSLSRFEEAMPILREAALFSFSLPADEQQVHFALGVCLENVNDTEGAKQEFARVVTLGLGNDIEERALWRLAILQYKAGALAQAKQQLETILRDFPTEKSVVPRRQVYEALSQTYRYLGDKANEKLYDDRAKGA